MKTWELRGVTVDRWGFPIAEPSGRRSGGAGEPDEEVDPGRRDVPPPVAPTLDARVSER
jgi:hypothetical protein